MCDLGTVLHAKQNRILSCVVSSRVHMEFFLLIICAKFVQCAECWLANKSNLKKSFHRKLSQKQYGGEPTLLYKKKILSILDSLVCLDLHIIVFRTYETICESNLHWNTNQYVYLTISITNYACLAQYQCCHMHETVDGNFFQITSPCHKKVYQ